MANENNTDTSAQTPKGPQAENGASKEVQSAAPKEAQTEHEKTAESTSERSEKHSPRPRNRRAQHASARPEGQAENRPVKADGERTEAAANRNAAGGSDLRSGVQRAAERSRGSERTDRPDRGGSADRGASAGRSGSADRGGRDASGRNGGPRRSGAATGNRTSASRDNDPKRRQKSVSTGNRTERASGKPAAPAGGLFGTRWTWRDYLVQLSVVILGTVLTFVGSGMISRCKVRQQEKTVMKHVVEELQENRRQVDSCTEKLIHERNGLEMVGRYGYALDRIPEDSLRHYSDLWSMRRAVFMAEAVEALKNPDLFQSVDDKQLILRILGCYRGLEAFAANVEEYNAFKFDALKHLYASGRDGLAPMDDPRGAWGVWLEDAMCRSFIRNAATYFGEDDYLRHDIAGVEKTIAAINEKYGFE